MSESTRRKRRKAPAKSASKAPKKTTVLKATKRGGASPNARTAADPSPLRDRGEPLATVNGQSHDKMGELETTTSDMFNLLASADIATVLLGLDRRIRHFTPAAKRLFNLIASDIGRRVDDITVRFGGPQFAHEIEEVMRDLAPREREVQDNDGRWYIQRINPYRTAENRIEGVVLTYEEITPIKRAQEQSRSAEDLEELVAERTEALRKEVAEHAKAREQLRIERDFTSALLDAAPALVLVRDREGRVVRFNKACEIAAGYAFEEIKDRPTWDALIPANEVELVKQVFEDCRAGRVPLAVEVHWQRRDGSLRLISWWTTSLRDADGSMLYAIGIGTDVTEQRRNEQVAREREKQVAHMHRVLTASGLASVLAHELNQPLAAIALYCEAGVEQLRQGTAVPDELMHDLEHIMAQAQRAAQVIANLRSFMSKSEMKAVPASVYDIVRATWTLIEPRARTYGVALELDIADDLRPVLVVPVHIEHVLLNLVHNSIDAIHQAGMRSTTVTIGARAVPGNFVEVVVRDTGPGVNAAALERVFEPFYTTRPDGLGMGLQVSRSIVEAHGGKLWAEAVPNGATFRFTVPEAPPSESSGPGS